MPFAFPQILQACCERSDGSPYAHPGCGCPTVKIVGEGTLKRAEMCGWCEFGSASTPPRYYRQYALSGGWGWSSASPPGTPTPLPAWSESFSGAGASGWQWNGATGALPSVASLGSAANDYTIGITNFHHETGNNGSVAANEAQTCLVAFNQSPGVSASMFTDGEDTLALASGRTISPFSAVFHRVSETEIRFTVEAGTHDGSEAGNAIRYTHTGGTVAIELSDEDTEAGALGRAEASTFRCGAEVDDFPEVYSIRETRADDAWSFLDLRARYAILCENLALGLAYQVTVKFQRRAAKGYGQYGLVSGYDAQYGAWEDVDEDFTSDPFTATAVQRIIGGTAADADDSGAIIPAEIGPEMDFPSEAGYQYRVAAAFIDPSD